MISQGLKLSLNDLREKASQDYKDNIIEIDDNTDIGQFASPIISIRTLQNEFCSSLIQRIVYTQFELKLFKNPLRVLEGDRMPLGYSGQEIFVNPAEGRDFDGNDFAGLLKKYESDVKVQYHNINLDRQYPVTISRQALKKAFTSWGDLEEFITAITNSLYNGTFIDQFKYTKNVIAGAYKDNKAQIEKITSISTEAQAKEFITKARTLFLNFQTPSSKYNAWSKCGGYGKPINTFTEPENIVFVIRNDLQAYLDVNVLANAFNIDKTTLLGNIISVDNFDFVDNSGNVIYDGSNILGLIADKSWFRIKEQDMFVDDFYNANNRTLQTYLNVIKMYNFSLFANGVIFATDNPVVAISGLDFNKPNGISIVATDDPLTVEVGVTPVTSNTPTITYTSSDTSACTVTEDPTDNRKCVITPVAAGTSTITATAGNVTATVTVTVTAS